MMIGRIRLASWVGQVFQMNEDYRQTIVRLIDGHIVPKILSPSRVALIWIWSDPLTLKTEGR